MDKPASSLTAEARVVKEAYDALNRNDVAGFVKDFDPEIERIEPSDSPGGGIYRGIESVKAHVSFHRANWAEGGCEPERFVVSGDRVIAFVHVRVRLKDEKEWREGDATDVFSFRDGKVIQFRTFFDRQQALDFAGVQASDAR